MIVSLNEIESLAGRAALGVGATWGAADDAAAAALRWLLARGLPAAPLLVAALDKVASGISHWGRLEERPAAGAEVPNPPGGGGSRFRSGLWSAGGGRHLSTVLIGGAASDWLGASAAEGRAALCLESVDVPLLLLPSILTAAARQGFDVHVSWPGFAASGRGSAVALQGCDAAGLAACRGAAVTVTVPPPAGQTAVAMLPEEQLLSFCRRGFEVEDEIWLRLERHAWCMLVPESRASRAGGAGPLPAATTTEADCRRLAPLAPPSTGLRVPVPGSPAAPASPFGEGERHRTPTGSPACCESPTVERRGRGCGSRPELCRAFSCPVLLRGPGPRALSP